MFAFSILLLIFLFQTTACARDVSYVTLSIPDQKPQEVVKNEVIITTVEEKSKLKPQNWEWKEKEQNPPLEGKNLLNFRGIDFYPNPNPYLNKESFDSLDALLKIREVDWIQIRFFLFQEGINSNKVIIDETQDEVLEVMIEKIHQSGRKVSLIPHFILNKDLIWGALIEPTNEKEWFLSYKEGILHYAVLAEEKNVELFSIANEMVSLWNRNEEWEKVIKAVREVYKGKVTAKMNCWWQEGYFQAVLKMNWMSKLDYIGIAPYFDLTNKKNPSLEEIKNSWTKNRHGLNVVQELEDISKNFQKKIVFLEIGFRSVDGANIEPWNSESIVPRGNSVKVKPDQEEQALATQALFDVFFDKDWFEGVFWFYWPTKIVIDPDDTSWTIPGKMVEEVIWENFRKERGEAE